MNRTYTGDNHYDSLTVKFKNFTNIDTESDPFEKCQDPEETEQPTQSTSSDPSTSMY